MNKIVTVLGTINLTNTKILDMEIAMKHLIILILFVFSLSSAKAGTINANSGSRQDIQIAINQARSGDTVLVPAGNFNFSGTLNMPSGITLMGAGIDNTILQRTDVSKNYMIQVNCSNTEPFRITGFTFIGVAPNDGNGIKVRGNSYNFRIDNNKFTKFQGWAALLFYFADFRGVIDHNEFIDNWSNQIFINGNRDAGWSGSLNLGTDDAVFIEDNYFKQGNFSNSFLSHHIDGQYGAKWVFRYNTIEDDRVNSQAIGAHGAYVGSSENRGNRSFEIYNNTMSATNRHRAVKIRGGDGVIFNNVFDGKYNNGGEIHIQNEDANTGEGGNCSYPCQDQIRNLYIWNNTSNGSPAQVYNQHPGIIQQERDYFLQEKPGYAPFTYPHPMVEGATLPLRISTSGLPGAQLGEPYSVQLRASGGQAPYQWQIQTGTLPSGISLSGNLITGTTSSNEGSYDFTVQVTDTEGSSVTSNLSIQVFSGNFSAIPYLGDAKNWEPNNQSYWAVSEKDGDKRYVITTTNLSSSDSKLATYSLIKNQTYSNFHFLARIKSPENLLENSGADFAILFGYQDDDNYYYMLLNSNSSWSALHKIQNGTRTELMAVSNVQGISDNEYHEFSLSKNGNSIRVQRDGNTLLALSDNTFETGKIGIGALNDAAYFDDIQIDTTQIPDLPPAIPQNLIFSK